MTAETKTFARDTANTANRRPARAEEPIRLPEMTKKHVEAMQFLESFAALSARGTSMRLIAPDLAEVLETVRSLSTGSHGLYDKRSEVKVKRDFAIETQMLAGKLRNAAQDRHDKDTEAVAAEIWRNIRRWLSSDTQHEAER